MQSSLVCKDSRVIRSSLGRARPPAVAGVVSDALMTNAGGQIAW
jgi:hypothetical protein